MAFLVAFLRSKWNSLGRSEPTSYDSDSPEDIFARKVEAEGWKALGRSQPTSVRVIEEARERKERAEKEAELRRKENEEKEWAELVKESEVDIHYQRIKNLWVGKFGRIHLAIHRMSGRYCTIKERTYESLSEIKFMNRLSDSPFFIKLLEVFTSREIVYIVMENAGGGSLRYFLRNHQFEDTFLPFYAAEILIGLRYLHNHNIIHRNLSPDSLFVTTDGHMKIGGFSCAKQDVWDGEKLYEKVGSPFYMAPERFGEEGYTKFSDYWSYGLVLIEILGFPNPFVGKYEEQKWEATKEFVCDPKRHKRLAVISRTMKQSHGLIHSLLQEESRRIKPEEILHHLLFQRTNWEAMERQTIWPPLQGFRTNYQIQGEPY
ncbi:hypothetical protein CAEBREN_11200 [Caenorhabditis brenneri]|uniref:Protein kinase domain-containing protein n=1 Tax=Caenorhabditis brenneri TaxID=135651 RepID=G0NFG1_CAEBE|nr:hypothetical protein CAEBREN_11200 [Caenorhabditis brenneri]